MANSTPQAHQASSRGYRPTPSPAPARRPGFWRDVYNGAVFGDFVRVKRLPGAATQIALSFTPLVGTICAVRDCVAALRYRDVIGLVLNLFALIPVFGGIPKTIEVLHSLWHMGHVLHVSRQAQRTPAPAAYPYGAYSGSAASPAQLGGRVKPVLLVLSLFSLLCLAAAIYAMSGNAFPAALGFWRDPALLLALFAFAAACAWIGGLVRTVAHARWGWFLAILFLNPLTTLLYATLGPREARL